jgi:hypothetical protein
MGECWHAWTISRWLARVTFRDALCCVPNVTRYGGEIDLLVVKHGYVIDCEVKVSRSDLRADIKKDKWWRFGTGYWDPDLRRYTHPEKERREWPHRAWKHYYALPAAIWDEALLPCIPAVSGVLLVSECGGVKAQRVAKPKPDATKLSYNELAAVARLASLRMWDALEGVR